MNKLQFTLSTATVEIGKTFSIDPLYTPISTTQRDLIWSSSKEDIATVDNKGKVTGKKLGSTVITATSKDNSNIKASYTLTVKEAEEKEETKETIKLDPNNLDPQGRGIWVV